MNWKEGQPLAPLVKPSITREQLVNYAEAAADHNPIHLDENFAKEAGFPSVIAHGMISMAFLADYVRFQFPESEYRLHRMRSRFRKVVFPGDILSCSGSVKRITPEGTIFVTVSLSNQRGEVATDGEAELTAAVR